MEPTLPCSPQARARMKWEALPLRPGDWGLQPSVLWPEQSPFFLGLFVQFTLKPDWLKAGVVQWNVCPGRRKCGCESHAVKGLILMLAERFDQHTGNGQPSSGGIWKARETSLCPKYTSEVSRWADDWLQTYWNTGSWGVCMGSWGMCLGERMNFKYTSLSGVCYQPTYLFSGRCHCQAVSGADISPVLTK